MPSPDVTSGPKDSNIRSLALQENHTPLSAAHWAQIAAELREDMPFHSLYALHSVEKELYLFLNRSRGEIGRHAILRGWCP